MATNDSSDTISVNTIALNMEYDDEQTLILIANMASGLNVDQATRSGTVMVTKIESTDFSQVSGIRLTDAANGRRILDCIDSAMQKCGCPLVASVKSGINLEAAAAEKQRENGEIEEEIQELALVEVMTYVKPEREFYEAEAKDQFRMAKEQLKKLQDSLSTEDVDKLTETELIAKHAELKVIAKEVSEAKYYSALKNYMANIDKQNSSKASLAGLRKKQQRNNVFDTVFQSLIAAKTNISKKVKLAVKNYPVLIEKLNERIAVNGILVKDSYNTDNLTGMYNILKRTYGKATLISVNRWLLDSMSMSVTYETLKSNPEHGLNMVLECLKEEEQIKLWEYMTKDMFFTALLLRMYQNNQSLYVDIAQEAMRYLHQQEQDHMMLTNEELTSEERAMPIFFHLNHHIKEVLVKAKDFAKKNEQITTKPTDGANTSAKGGGKTTKIPTGLETAANATDKSETKKDKFRDVKNMTFKKEVNRNENLGYYHPKRGKWFPYTATKEACKKCQSDKDQHSAPLCFLMMCTKCGLYGHRQFTCKQVVHETKAAAAQVDADADAADDEEIPA